MLKHSVSMKTSQSSNKNVDQAIAQEANQLADFVLFTQRSCILNLSPELNEGRVSFPQFFLLTYLASEEFLTMSNIAKKMGHSTAASTGMVDKLEEMGYISRVHAANDRRKIMVKITDKGKKLVEKMRKNIVRDLASILADPDSANSPIKKMISTDTKTRSK